MFRIQLLHRNIFDVDGKNSLLRCGGQHPEAATIDERFNVGYHRCSPNLDETRAPKKLKALSGTASDATSQPPNGLHLPDGESSVVEDDGSTLSVAASEDGNWLVYK